LVPLGFLIRRTGTEPRKMKNMTMIRSDETPQSVMLSRSPHF